MPHVDWDIRREGRAWTGAEFESRLDLRPEKLEAWEGRLLFDDEERLLLLGLLLENVGVDAAVRLGDPNVLASRRRRLGSMIEYRRAPMTELMTIALGR